MNIRHALEYAEKFLNEGLIDSAEGYISYAENYLILRDPNGSLNDTPTFCCFITSGNIIHCGRNDEEPLFPGTWEERIKLCRECRNWCRAKIKELRGKISEKREKEKFIQEFFSKNRRPRGMYLPPKWAAGRL